MLTITFLKTNLAYWRKQNLHYVITQGPPDIITDVWYQTKIKLSRQNTYLINISFIRILMFTSWTVAKSHFKVSLFNSDIVSSRISEHSAFSLCISSTALISSNEEMTWLCTYSSDILPLLLDIFDHWIGIGVLDQSVGELDGEPVLEHPQNWISFEVSGRQWLLGSQIWWRLWSPALRIVNPDRFNRKQTHTTMWINFIKELLLCSCHQTSIVSWNAVPIVDQRSRDSKMNFKKAYQIAWSFSLKFLALARSDMKAWMVSISFVVPASIPRESWNTNPGLLSNINSSVISWTPRWKGH